MKQTFLQDVLQEKEQFYRNVNKIYRLYEYSSKKKHNVNQAMTRGNVSFN